MSELSAEQTRMAQLWEEHMRHEFQTCSTEDTLATMVEDSYVNHVKISRGGFPAAFFVAALKAIGVQQMRLEDV